MTDKPKSKWYWRLLRWGLIGLAVLATLVGLLVTEENWRGKRDWQAYRLAAEASGERLDMASVIPPTVPDDQNFFAAPIVVEALLMDQNSPRAVRIGASSTADRMDFNLWHGNIANEINQGGNWQKGTLTGLKQWQTAFRNFSATVEGKTNGFPVPMQPQTPATDVLLGLSVFDPALEELRQASQRPYARMPLDYEKGFEAVEVLLPWLAREKRCAQLLQLRILAELEAGQSQQALDDVKLFIRLIDGLRDQPFLITHLVRLAMMHIVIQTIYEGLAQHRWNDAQLAELETVLAAQDYLADFGLAMRGERTCAIQSFETQRLTRKMKSDAQTKEGAGVIVTNSLCLMPSAYFYQNELAFSRMYEQYVLPLVDMTNRTVSVAAYNTIEADSKAQMKHYSPYTVQALMTFPAVSKAVEKFVFVQASVDLAQVAIALERYRLAHGEYPASLDALAPQFIERMPHDIINGEPLHYRLTNDGKFVLYSVGWNEKDDGGTVVLTKEGAVDRKKGDWVWKYSSSDAGT
jgi:hypothetical protein